MKKKTSNIFNKNAISVLLLCMLWSLTSCHSEVNLETGPNAPGSNPPAPPAQDPPPAPPCTASVTLLDTIPNATGSHGQSAFILGTLGLSGTSTGTDGMQIVDISDPANPVNHAHFDSSGLGLLDIYAESTVAYASSINGDLISINISDPDNPALLDTLTIGGENWGVTAKGNYLYVGSFTTGLNIVNKTDPANLVSAAIIPGYGFTHMQIIGDIIYGTDGRIISILNISDPIAPTLVGQIDLGTSFMAYELHKAGNYIYTNAKPQGLLQTIDISDPSNPTLVYTSTAVGDGLDFRSIAGNDDKIFIGTGSGESGGVRVYDIKNNPIEPLLEDTATASNRIYELHLKDNLLFTSNRGGQSDIFSYSCN